MDISRLALARTELDFLQRLLLDVQRRLAAGGPLDAADPELVAALELALAFLRWDGEMPPELDAQVGLGAAVQLKLGGDGMCAYRQWRSERRRRPPVPTPGTSPR
ncbi:hypothetical protein GCM10028796_33930 [Ramlibacter monticola]|uniref:Uncharacterized protein n=1 Tax=Ramlibacter monticola TaxID=1926872 RepID=A0A937CUU4_9BURK|nr:hypothetical protein [Ramlibacter monticola]MBL0394035.1 hypothetical protein [Ramlibacter monticola]